MKPTDKSGKCRKNIGQRAKSGTYALNKINGN